MRTLETIAELTHQARTARERGDRVGVVLCDTSLGELTRHVARAAHAQCDFVVLALPSDVPFSRYPSIEADVAWRDPLLRGHHPSDGPFSIDLHLPDITNSRLTTHLEHTGLRALRAIGATGADVLYVAQEPYHECRVVQMALEMTLSSVEIRPIDSPLGADGAPLADGLHSDTERTDRAHVHAELQAIHDAVADASTRERISGARLLARVEAALSSMRGLSVDMLEIIDPVSLAIVSDLYSGTRRLVLRATASWGKLNASVPLDLYATTLNASGIHTTS